jgi:hypothetical protein
LREIRAVVIIENVPHASGIGAVSFGCESRHNQREANSPRSLRTAGSETWPGSSGVERSPEKAGVGGSIPSLATTFSITYKHAKAQFHSVSFQNFWLGGFAFVV